MTADPCNAMPLQPLSRLVPFMSNDIPTSHLLTNNLCQNYDTSCCCCIPRRGGIEYPLIGAISGTANCRAQIAL